jgi:hypothetical protein
VANQARRRRSCQATTSVALERVDAHVPMALRFPP